MIEKLFLWMVGASAGASLVLGLLFVLRRWLRRRYSAATLALVWLAPMARLLLPLPPLWPRPLVALPPAAAPAPPTSLAATAAGGTAVAAPTGWRPMALLAAAWALTAALLTLGQLAGALASAHALRRASRPAPPSFGRPLWAARQRQGLRRAVELRVLPGLGSPLVVGLARPLVLLPSAACPPQDLQLLLEHELAHLRRGDLVYKALLRLCVAVHWFNPLVWWMAAAAAQNLELRCDDAVMRGRDPAVRRRYAGLLLTMAQPSGLSPTGARFGGGKTQLKRRLDNMYQKKKQSAWPLVVAMVVVLAAALLVGCAPAPADALRQLTDSISITDDARTVDLVEEDGDQKEITFTGASRTLSLTLPQAEGDGDWRLWIAGRAVYPDGTSMSVRWLEMENWSAGPQSVSRPREDWDALTELTLVAVMDGEEYDVDLLPYLP